VATELFSNQPFTTVTSGGTDAPASGTQESWTVASSSEFPAASSANVPPTQFHVADIAVSASTEIIAVTNVSGTTWTVTRGAESTAPVTHQAGFTVSQVVTAGGLTPLSFPPTWVSPANATGETFPRTFCFSAATPSSGRLQVNCIALPSGTPVNNITFATGSTPASGVTHGWYALLDSGGTVRAVSADQGSGTWNTANTPTTLSVSASAYTTTYSGLYYVGWMVAVSAGTVCTMTTSASSLTGGLYSVSPVQCGTYGSGLTTPPAVGSAITISANSFWPLYAYTS